MEEKLLVIEHKELAGKTLTVPKEVAEDGKLVLDEKGQATLPSKAAHFLCTVPGFSIVEGSKKEEKSIKIDTSNENTPPKEPEKEEKKQTPNPNPPVQQPTPEELEAKELGLQFITEDDKIVCVDDEFVNLLESNHTYGATQAEALEAYKKEFIESKEPVIGDPNPSWKKEELAAWLTERKIEFKAKDGKEVLLGKAFKFLEENKEQHS